MCMISTDFSLGVSAAVVRQLKSDLQLSRNYLKCDYKLHIQSESTIPDHCRAFSLNDLCEKEWQQSCDHDHRDRCQGCLLLDQSFHVLMSSLENCKSNCPPDKYQRYLHRIEHNFELIYDWKSHILRSVHQDEARLKLFEDLDSKSVLLQIDWAMKFLSKEYRESQRQWFGL